MTGTGMRRRNGKTATFAWLTTLLALLAAVSLVACGGSASSGAAASSTAASQAAGDPFTEAWPRASEAMKPLASDAMLVAVSTPGLGPSDSPQSWSFTYFSQERSAVYSVPVDQGAAGTPQKLGAVKKGVKVTNVVDAAAVNVGAGQAIKLARALGEKRGAVPRDVLVGGIFAELPGAAEAGYAPGYWTVVFAAGADLAGAQTFAVNMHTGAVQRIKTK